MYTYTQTPTHTCTTNMSTYLDIVPFDISEKIYKSYFSHHVISELEQVSPKRYIPDIKLEDWPFPATSALIIHDLYRLITCLELWPYVKSSNPYVKVGDNNDIKSRLKRMSIMRRHGLSDNSFDFIFSQLVCMSRMDWDSYVRIMDELHFASRQ